MIEKTRHAGDAELRFLLKSNDPVTPPSHAFLAALEADILARVDNPFAMETGTPPWMLPQGWHARTATFAVLLVVMAGFIVGRVSANAALAPSLIGVPSLLAFADENAQPPVSATDTAWGDDDDSAE